MELLTHGDMHVRAAHKQVKYKSMWSDYKTYAKDRVVRERRERMKDTRALGKKYKIKEVLTRSHLKDMVQNAIAEDGGELEPTI